MKKGISRLTWCLAIFGGFLLGNLIMGIIVQVISSDPAGKLIIPVIFLPVAWSFSAMWILNSKTSLKALLKTIYSVLFSGSVGAILFLMGGING